MASREAIEALMTLERSLNLFAQSQIDAEGKLLQESGYFAALDRVLGDYIAQRALLAGAFEAAHGSLDWAAIAHSALPKSH
ncbi:MAG: hypothetical protein KU37_04850 [Sulfuricurvum sp. PC08-66]|nr:MAG: hypothetical protein KU37_04850 [Sulfuricurvum sp. PC08-66]